MDREDTVHVYRGWKQWFLAVRTHSAAVIVVRFDQARRQRNEYRHSLSINTKQRNLDPDYSLQFHRWQ